jgi:predicted DNA-binding transcriptional regulator AlpA
VATREVRAVLRQLPDGWSGRVAGHEGEIRAKTREGCLGGLRSLAGEGAVLTVEVTSRLVGVSEAAEILGWDRRRVITYVDRGSFPAPVARLASGRVWRRDDVELFARAFARRQARRKASS